MYQDVPFWVPLFQLKGREAAKEMWLIRQRQMGTSEPILLDPVFAQLLIPHVTLLPTEPKSQTWSL